MAAAKKATKKTMQTGGPLPPEVLVVVPAPEKEWFGVKRRTVLLVGAVLVIVAVLIFYPF